MLLNCVIIATILEMTLSKEDCRRYYFKRNVEIDGCDKTTSLEQEINSVQCLEYCEKDPKVNLLLYVSILNHIKQ